MKQIELKYGCNPNQQPSRIFMEKGELPLRVLNGKPGYINFLDALNSWQLVKELKEALGLAAAASFKHVSPAGAAVGLPLSDTDKIACAVNGIEGMDDSPLAAAYARARGADRMSSFGDFIALSEVCDAPTARIIKREVSDGVIAPGYSREALELLKTKKKGAYSIIEIDADYLPEPTERKQVFGVTFEQRRNDAKIDAASLQNIVTQNKKLTKQGELDLLLALIALKYTQSNSVCFAEGGQTIGVGAGQQSRIHCTRLAGNKADIWHLRRHPRVLELEFAEGMKSADCANAIDIFLSDRPQDVAGEGVWSRYFKKRPRTLSPEEKREFLAGFNEVALGSDAFFPFADNIERAARSGVCCIAQPGGSLRDDEVIATCDRAGMVMAFTGQRLFHH